MKAFLASAVAAVVIAVVAAFVLEGLDLSAANVFQAQNSVRL